MAQAEGVVGQIESQQLQDLAIESWENEGGSIARAVSEGSYCQMLWMTADLKRQV
jgi:hypothetical protein